MSWIYVDFEGMNYINAGFSTAISQMCVLKSKYQRIVEGCDAELLYETEVSVKDIKTIEYSNTENQIECEQE